MQWHYLDGRKTIGPISEAEMFRLIDTGVVNKKTLVWNESMKDWACVGETSLRNRPTPRGIVEPIQHPMAVDEPKRRVFFLEIAGAFIFPFKGSGPIFIVIGWLFFWSARFAVGMGGIFGIIAFFLFAGYLCAYMLKIIAHTAAGEDEMPDWPSIGHGWEEIMYPYFMVLIGLFACFAPLAVFSILWWKTGFFNIYVFGGLIALGFFVQPMVFLSLAMHESFMGLNPGIIFIAIVKTFFAYLFVIVVLIFILAVRTVGVALLTELTSPIVASLICYLIAFYFSVVEMRMLGVLFRCHEHKLNWFDL